MKINQVLVESAGATVAFAFGRFNPAHQGHIEVWRAVEEAGANWFVGTNPNTIGPNDPLTFEQKSAWMEEIYPPISGHIVSEQTVLSLAAYIFKKTRKNERATVAYITDSADWAWSGKLLNQYNGVEGAHGYYKFAQITHVPSPRVSSATALRDAARADDKVAFYHASGTDPKSKVAGLTYFDTVKQAVEKYPLPVKRGQKVKEPVVTEGAEYFNGIEISMEKEDDEINVKAMMAGGRELGHVLFVIDGEYLMPQDLEVDERYQGQGIAATMYNYVKSKGYKIRRSGQQTDAGAGFWDKHKPGKNVWEQGVAEGAMPASVIRIKEKIRLMSDSEKKEYFKGKTREQLQQMAQRHGYGENSNVYAKYATQGVAEGNLKEFAPGAGDEGGGEDPYKYPKPESYRRSADFFGQFEADHFDREDMNDATGEFKGYWGKDQIAYFKFNNPAKTGSDDPGMGWYYEPQSNLGSDKTSAVSTVDTSAQRKQQELSMISAFLKSGQTPKPGSQIHALMKKQGVAEGSDTETNYDGNLLVSLIQNYTPQSYAGDQIKQDLSDPASLPFHLADVVGLIDEIFYESLENGSEGVVLSDEKQDLRFFYQAAKKSQKQGMAEGSEPDAYGRTGEKHECGSCDGTGIDTYDDECPECGGKGWVRDKESLKKQGVAEAEQKTVAKTWDQMTSQEKLSGVKGRTVWNERTQKYYTVFDVPVKQSTDEASLATMRDYFAGDKDAQDPTTLAKQRQWFDANKDTNGRPVVQKKFRSKWDYEQWLKQNKLKQISGANESTNDKGWSLINKSKS